MYLLQAEFLKKIYNLEARRKTQEEVDTAKAILICCMKSVVCMFFVWVTNSSFLMLDLSVLKCLQGLCKSQFYQAEFSGLV